MPCTLLFLYFFLFVLTIFHFHVYFIGGNPPKDHQGKRNDLITMPKTMFIFMCVSGSFGICLAFAFLCFNVRNRNRRYLV